MFFGKLYTAYFTSIIGLVIHISGWYHRVKGSSDVRLSPGGKARAAVAAAGVAHGGGDPGVVHVLVRARRRLAPARRARALRAAAATRHPGGHVPVTRISPIKLNSKLFVSLSNIKLLKGKVGIPFKHKNTCADIPMN